MVLIVEVNPAGTGEDLVCFCLELHFPCVSCRSNQHLMRSGLKACCSDGAQCLALDLVTVGEESVLWKSKSFQCCPKQFYDFSFLC